MNSYRTLFLFGTLLTVSLAATTVCAKDSQPPNGSQRPVKILLHPMPEPSPALKYRLLPTRLGAETRECCRFLRESDRRGTPFF